MDWAIYLLQLANPFVGSTGAIPLALGVFDLPAPAVFALVVPVNLVQVGVMHFIWQGAVRRPRVRAFLERRRSPRIAALLDERGAFVAALAATFLLGTVPTYISLRWLGVPLARVWAGVALGCAGFGALVTGICTLAGL